jgi:Mn2+/Fe2+ NRAMP family transporter
MRAARIETLAGVLLCQTISSVLLIASAATLGGYGALDSVARIETAFTATLGMVAGRVVFVLGLSGSALVATIVVCLTLAWTVGEVLGVRHSLEQHPRQAPWFYGSMTTMLVAGRAVVASGVDLVDLSIAAGVLNALLLPLVLSFLFCLARVALPEPWRLRSGYAAAVAVCFACIGGVCLYTGIAGMF